MEKLGYVAHIFGVISTSPIDVYLSAKKSFKKYTVAYVDYNETSVEDVDILIFNGVKTFLGCVNSLKSNMVAIVCGGPLQIDSLPSVIPLDYSKSLSYRFDLKKIEFSNVLKRLKSEETKPKKVKSLKIDHLTLILDNTAGGGVLLTEWNKMQSVINMTGRNILRAALQEILLGKKPITHLKDSADFIKSDEILKRLDDVAKKMKTQDFANLSKVITASFNSAKPINIKSEAKKNNLDEFELVFFRKMIAQHNKALEKKTYAPASRGG
jgi:hypothetical protein